ALAKSEEQMRQVLAIDPRYTPAWDELARNFFERSRIGMATNEESYARSREAVEKAIEIDPQYAAALAMRARISVAFENDWAGAAAQLERALALDPANSEVLRGATVLLAVLGRIDEALLVQKAVVRHDPVNTAGLSNLGLWQRSVGQLDDALDSFHTALNLNP